MNCLIVVTLFLLVALNLQAQAVDRVIRQEVIVDAGVNEVSNAWKDVVLPRLKYRFSVGPVNWENPPRLK